MFGTIFFKYTVVQTQSQTKRWLFLSIHEL